MIIRKRGFSGGYRFRNFRGEPQKKLVDAQIPDKVIIPLRQGFGNEVPPVVEKGEKVRAGQIIGIDDDSISTPVHSSVNGVVDEIVDLRHPDGDRKALVINSDGTSDWQQLKGGTSRGEAGGVTDWKKYSRDQIEEKLYLSGATSLGRSGIPTRYKSSVIAPSDVEHLVIHGIGSEVYHSSLLPFLEGDMLEHFVEGVRILKTVLRNASVHVALNRLFRSFINLVHDKVKGYEWLKLYSIEPRYPQERDELLISTLFGSDYPYGYFSANIGIIVFDIQTVLHVYDAVAQGKPLIERIVALCGPEFFDNLYLNVRLGASIDDIAGSRVKNPEGCRYIVNKPLTGSSLSDFLIPIDRTVDSVTALSEGSSGEFVGFAKPGFTKDSYTRTFASSFLNLKRSIDTNLHGEKRPCIFCGFCEDVCPVAIVPHLIYRNVEHDNIDERLIEYKIFKCIDCNLCTYVCPSKIQVAHYIKDGKDKLRKMEMDHVSPISSNIKLKGFEELKGLSR
jgi:Na+-translocating ferredoxin:NAD+ oxidoreductase RnfC subunit